ncbi:Bacterial alpha-L-rhamnosidase [Granulicella sp. 5B5]|uniref:alpha-L-rhamnosidase-related protein n=1 Tax=Granulicella sp. 5B5 TaxID=1617967 RepID=UPI0015F6C7A4|nr:alpha-L-rhamnosidase C-terminal domain-containing protein [Granulicella sp. 5B5]QMV19430.1 Bacterial alpha-L-rhamnosidase [Granulicella sp. 5B5]
MRIRLQHFRYLLPCTLALGVFGHLTASAQANMQSEPLDPVRDATGATLERTAHQPLPEQYIWTASSHTENTSGEQGYVRPAHAVENAPHYFRVSFRVEHVPAQATLYIAGPRSANVYLNGQHIGSFESDITQPLGVHVFAMPVASVLKPGANVLALKVVRGRGINSDSNSALVMQQTFGEVLVAKILPEAQGILAKPLMMTDASWKSTTQAGEGWQTASFDDSAWPHVHALGSIESTLDLFQWNADAGLYDWPGYDGISPFLAHRHIMPHAVLSSTEASGHIDNLTALTNSTPNEFAVHLSATHLPTQQAPNIILDFGRELTGRLELVSDSAAPAQVTVQYGESYDEMMKSPYLGIDLLYVAPHQTAHGPKSSFRYAKISFIGGGPELRFKSIAVDDIFYPVKYQGSFESSDPMLNRIWEVGAYTAHLCMQDSVWDSPKRDRGRWMGDTDVMGRTIEDVFDDHFLMEDTLDRLLGPAPVKEHVNGIPGYSAFWFTGVAQYYRETGSKAFLEKERARMLQLLAYVDKEFDEHSVYANKTHVWLYVDWSPEFSGDTPETRRATTLEFYNAYSQAVWMLRELGDTANADHYAQRAEQIKAGAQKYLLDPATGTFGPRWQSNAAAVVSGAADPSEYPAIWNNVLSHVGHVRYNGLVVTPYYNYYVISAMAQVGHRKDALDWIKQYWGGMVDEGATSFWEAYDPDWFKDDFHASLQADGRSGYFVSLAHGWSSGATPWLMEQVLGINARGAGFSEVDIRPDLIGLQWARGAEPTPHGLLKVDIRGGNAPQTAIDIPEGVHANVSVPLARAGASVLVNGEAHASTPAENGTRAIVHLGAPGHYVFTSR